MIEVKSVQSAIAQRNAGWVAKDTWLNQLPAATIHRMLGVQRPPSGQLDFTPAGSERANTAVDWRNKDGVNWLGPVMNQGNCGSCVAFATVGTLEAQTSISAGAPWLRPTYSPEQLFMCGGASCDQGWMPDQAAQFLQQTGITDEACMPYSSGSTGVDVSCNQKCGDAAERTTKIAGSSQPSAWWSGSVDSVKAALQKGPVVTTLLVYADFLTYSSGVYKHVTGDAEGGHAVSIVGYDDAKRAWLIRNSWGEEWGDKGFAWVSWDDVSGVGTETWAFQLAPAKGTIGITAPADRAYVSGDFALTTQTQGLTAGSGDVHFTLLDDHGAVVKQLAATTAAAGNTATLATAALAEGRYQVFAQNTSGTRSQVREFYVQNSVPHFTIAFAPIAGVDLTKPVTGRPEFVVKSSYGAVPIQHVEFRVEDASGHIVAIKANDFVIPSMQMGWRTAGTPNGQYKIYFHGQTTYQGQVYTADSNAYTIQVYN